MLCLPKNISQPLQKAIENGSVDLQKLFNAKTSEERTAMLSEIVGKDKAKAANSSFEKNFMQKGGALSPEDQLAILKTTNEVINAKNAIKEGEKNGSKNRLEYGLKQIELNRKITDIKAKGADEATSILSGNPVPKVLQGVQDVGGFLKSVEASLDNSALFRQGSGALFTNPKIWLKNAAESFGNIAKQLGKNVKNESVADLSNADIYSRQNAINGYYDKAKLAIGNIEEAYPSSLPEKVPGIGRLFKAGQVGYEQFLYKTRADIFDKMIGIAEKTGVDLAKKGQFESIGKMVNSLTGRGDIGVLEEAGGFINNFFFSARKMKADFDVLTGHSGDISMSSFARKQAALNLTKIIAGTVTTLGIVEALYPGSVDTKKGWEISSDAGKVRFGDTTFDTTGGKGSMFILANRVLEGATKTAKTGKINALNTGKYGSMTTGDIISDFFTNKKSPLLNISTELWTGLDFMGKPIKKEDAIMQGVTPIIIQNLQQSAADKNSADPLAILISEGLGINTSTYKR